MRSVFALPILVMMIAPTGLPAQAMYPWSCTMAFQQRVHDATPDHASLVDSCLINAIQASPENWRCRVVTIHPEALRAAFEDRIDSSSAWQQMKVQNSDRLYAQRIGQAMNIDHVLLSSLNEDMEKALSGSNIALGQFRELLDNGTHISDPKSAAFKRFQYKAILVEAVSGKALQQFTFTLDITKPNAEPFCDRLARKFMKKSALRNK